MLYRIRGFLRHAIYASRGGFLVRPFAIAMFLGLLGLVLSASEDRIPAIGAWMAAAALPSRSDPQVAQGILVAIATSIMTVVSIVFAILLMTLTLASMQYSPRILLSFVRDKVTQWTLGVFLGTFTYCMAALPAVHFTPSPFAPVVTVMGAMLLALVCVGWLLFFIQHISQAISVNFIVDRIACDTERIIDQIAPHARSGAGAQSHPGSHTLEANHAVVSIASGYIRFIDAPALLRLATSARIHVRIVRRVGHFVAEGTPLFFVSRLESSNAALIEQLRESFDLGPARTLEQDVEFGVLQIVDIALRAISPAVNDPSTAISCIDQLTRLLIRWIGREAPQTYLASPPHVLRVVLPWVSSERLLETAFDQIRRYATADLAVSLRLARSLTDIAHTAADDNLRAILVEHGRRVVEGCGPRLDPRDIERLETRLSSLTDPIARPL